MKGLKKMITTNRIALLILILLAALNGSREARAEDPQAKSVVVKGVVVGLGLVEKLGAAFSKDSPHYSVIAYGARPDKALEQLISGKTDMVLLVKKVTQEQVAAAEQKGTKLRSILVGFAGPAIFTQLRNPVNELTLEQIRKIFTGDCSNWSEVNGLNEAIQVVAPAPRVNISAKMFEKFILQQRPFTKKAKFLKYASRVPKECATSQEYAIGFMPYSLYSTSRSKQAVKLLALKKNSDSPGVLPSQATLLDGSYVIAKPLYLCWNEKTTKQGVKAFSAFCQTKVAAISSDSAK
jgi:phosphate transport system substrate-binding protein